MLREVASAMRKKLVLLTLAAFPAARADADSGYVYVGAGVTRGAGADFSYALYAPGCCKATIPDGGASWQATFGWRSSRWLAVEAQYLDMTHGGWITDRLPAVSASLNTDVALNRSAAAIYTMAFAPGDVQNGLTALQFTAPFGVAQLLNSGFGFRRGLGLQLIHYRHFRLRLEYKGFRGPLSSSAGTYRAALYYELH
jgi:hypothetical protein